MFKLRYREDRRSLIFIAITLAVHGLFLSLNTANLSLVSIFCLALAQGVLCYLCHCINHNFIHVPIFTNKRDNNIFAVFLGIAQGLSPTSLIVTHNLKHHKHLAKTTDWFHDRHAGKGPGVWRLIRYVAVVWFLIGKERYKDESVKLSPKLARQEMIENLGLIMFMSLALFVNWKAFLMLILPAWLFASFAITAINLVQHDGCDDSSEFSHSRNYTSIIGNWFFFNGGYHGAHHNKPAIHWSELPKYHAEIADKIPENLNSPSLPETLFRNYILKLK